MYKMKKKERSKEDREKIKRLYLEISKRKTGKILTNTVLMKKIKEILIDDI